MLDDIVEIINDALEIDIRDKIRTNEYVFGRALFYSIAYNNLVKKPSLSKMGNKVNVKTHGTVLNGIKIWDNELQYNDYYIELKEMIIGNLDLYIDPKYRTIKELKQKLNKVRKEFRDYKKLYKSKELLLFADMLEGLKPEQIIMLNETRIKPFIKMQKNTC